MRIKLDENLGNRGATMFRSAGHEVSTVFEEGLASSTDPTVIEACRKEGRCLVTLDLDFSNPLRFPPWEYHGIAVLRLPPRRAEAQLIDACRTLIAALQGGDIEGRLWIVEIGRIREYRPDRSDAEE